MRPPVPKPGQSVVPPAPKPVDVPPDTVVLTVGDMKLTAGQLDQIVDSLPEQARPMYRGPGRKQLADNLVKILVLAQEGKKRGLDQDSACIKTQVLFQMSNVLAGITYTAITKDLNPDDASLHESITTSIRANSKRLTPATS